MALIYGIKSGQACFYTQFEASQPGPTLLAFDQVFLRFMKKSLAKLGNILKSILIGYQSPKGGVS
ncbi:hypothetical protein ASF92_18960 [Pedobacter sp. Leaf176]|nr:hypothetical protein ASF92_18960 [Pedobacter sp. Leaf176]